MSIGFDYNNWPERVGRSQALRAWVRRRRSRPPSPSAANRSDHSADPSDRVVRGGGIEPPWLL